MPYKKRVRKDTTDKRPEKMQDGQINELIGTSLSEIQDILNLSNDTMSEILGCSGTYYDKVLSGEKGLTTDKLSRLYYNLGLDMNYLIGNDNNYSPLRAQEIGDVTAMEFEALLNALIKDIENTDGHDERVEKILRVYNRFGVMLRILMAPNNAK